jgi:hypothetical protein
MCSCKHYIVIHKSGTDAAIWSKTNFGPTGHHHPQSSPFLHVRTIPTASAILEVMFYLDHLNCVKMAAFQFYLQSGKQKSMAGGG